MFTPEQLRDIFTYHPPTDQDTIDKYSHIREAAFDLAIVICANTPPSADQTAAIRLLRQAVMTANAAIALEGKF